MVSNDRVEACDLLTFFFLAKGKGDRSCLTSIECIRADGIMVPSFLIFKGAKTKELDSSDFSSDTPKETKLWQNQKGFNTVGMMKRWIDHLVSFNKTLEPSRPDLLLVMVRTVNFNLRDKLNLRRWTWYLCSGS